MTRAERLPQRTCVACGLKADQAMLTRIVQGPDGKLSIGAGKREQGRGAYICPKRECWKKALQTQRLERALRTRLTDENRAALLQYSSTIEEVGVNG